MTDHTLPELVLLGFKVFYLSGSVIYLLFAFHGCHTSARKMQTYRTFLGYGVIKMHAWILTLHFKEGFLILMEAE